MSSTTAIAPKKRLGDRLLEAGLINQHQLELALREQKRTGRLIGRVLHELGFVTEQAIASFLAQDAQTPTVDLASLEVDPAVVGLLPLDMCRDECVLPCRVDGDVLTLVMADPFNVVAIDRVEQITRMKVEVLNAPKPDILEKLASLNDREGSLDQTIDELMKISGRTSADDTTAPMIRAIEQIIAAAVRAVTSLGTIISTSASPRQRPPPLPRNAMLFSPPALAAASACTMFALLPLVESTASTSPARPCA
jgi:type IV pilus assembly protein PilB